MRQPKVDSARSSEELLGRAAALPRMVGGMKKDLVVQVEVQLHPR